MKPRRCSCSRIYVTWWTRTNYISYWFLITDSQMEQGYRSEVQERALVVSLQMFSLILERGVSLLKAQLDSEQEPRLVVGEDLQVLLPAIKVLPPPCPSFPHQYVSVERSLNCVSRRESASVSQFPSRNVASITSIVRSSPLRNN